VHPETGLWRHFVNPLLPLASLILTTIIGYALLCAVVPWGRCRTCAGYGRKTGRNGTLTRTKCRRCNGTGRRVRVGRRVWTWIDREYRAGTR
jgi:hypothetical protein